MLEKLEARGRMAGERAVTTARRRVAEQARELPGVEAEESATGVVLIGWRLWERALTDARLRWIAGWLR